MYPPKIEDISPVQFQINFHSSQIKLFYIHNQWLTQLGFVINLAVTKMTRYYKYNYNKTLYIKAPFIYILILEI